MHLRHLSIAVSAVVGSALALPGVTLNSSAQSTAPTETTCARWANWGLYQEWGVFVPIKDGGADHRASVWIPNSDCGGGVLDNLRGICGVISFWVCYPVNEYGAKLDLRDPTAVGAVLSFTTTDFCTHDKVAGAVEAATNGVRPDCHAPATCPPFCARHMGSDWWNLPPIDAD